MNSTTADQSTPAAAERGGRAALLLGNYRVSLVIARQLAEAGFAVICGGPEDAAVRHSRHVDQYWDHPSFFKNPKVFIGSLEELRAERPDLAVIVPVSEPALLALVRIAGQLPLPLAAASRETVETCCDKGRMVHLAQELGVPQAPFALASDLEELVTAADAVGYPCVARPNDTRMHDVKAYFIGSRQHLRLQFPVWPKRHKSLLLQTRVVGLRYNRYFRAHAGQIEEALDVKILRTDRPDGSGYAVEGMSIPPVVAMDEPSQKLIEALDYSGVGCIQYLVDERRGTISFLEINPRIGGNYAFAESCGLDLVLPLVQRVIGEEPAPPAAAHKLGKRYIWLYGDAIGLFGSLYKRELGVRGALAWSGRTLRALLRGDRHLTFDSHDLGPARWFALRFGAALLAMFWDGLRFLKRKITSVLR